MIDIKDLNVSIKDHSVFKNLNLTIQDGECVGIVGKSGCGKSMLLRTMVGLHPADSGEILFDGMKLGDAKKAIKGLSDDEKFSLVGMVFQYYHLFEHLSVIENVVSGPIDILKEDRKAAFEKGMAILKKFGLADVAYRKPATLSGGQKQRAAIARTIAMNPRVVLLDEPTSSLDPMMKGEVEAVIRMLAAEGRTMIVVSHEMELIRNICTKVVFLNDGHVYEQGTPSEMFEHPKKKETRRFMRALRVLEFTVDSKDFDFIGINTKIREFTFSNGVPTEIQDRLLAIIEELFQMVIIQPKEDNKMHIALEYNKKTATLVGDVRFSGPLIDPDDPRFFFSWPIIVRRASDVKVEEINENGFTNSVKIMISKEK